jgi:hypothetical protein
MREGVRGRAEEKVMALAEERAVALAEELTMVWVGICSLFLFCLLY